MQLNTLTPTRLVLSLTATIAIGIASDAKYDATTDVAPKADMLPVAADAAPARHAYIRPHLTAAQQQASRLPGGLVNRNLARHAVGSHWTPRSR